jgi:hypothetical protein
MGMNLLITFVNLLLYVGKGILLEFREGRSDSFSDDYANANMRRKTRKKQMNNIRVSG